MGDMAPYCGTKVARFFEKGKFYVKKSSTFVVDNQKTKVEGMELTRLCMDESAWAPMTSGPSVATMGVFDGVHRGHLTLVERVRQEATRRGLEAVAVTFAVNPATVVGRQAPRELLTLEERLDRLAAAGIDRCVMLQFDRAMAALTAPQFMQRVLRDQLDVKVLVRGYDHRFGSDQRADAAYYEAEAQRLGMEVVTLPQLEDISSSAIRQRLAEGDVSGANRMLGYDYPLSGVVTDGYRMGRKMGFPTANLDVAPTKMLPADGVYAVRTLVHGRCYGGMMNIGPCPTFQNLDHRRPEVHLFDFDDDIYRERLTVEVVTRLRDEQRFASVDELVAQLKKDEVKAREELKMNNIKN